MQKLNDTNIKNVFFDVLTILSWSIVAGLASEIILPESILFELASVYCGASIGLYISWSIRFMAKKMKTP